MFRIYMALLKSSVFPFLNLSDGALRVGNIYANTNCRRGIAPAPRWGVPISAQRLKACRHRRYLMEEFMIVQSNQIDLCNSDRVLLPSAHRIGAR
jgi:hypothetical protein